MNNSLGGSLMASKTSSTTKKKNAGSSRKRTISGKKETNAKKNSPEISFGNEVALLVILAICIILFMSNFGIGGFIGAKVSGFFFGLFGKMAYLFPICFFIGAAFFISNRENGMALIKIVAGIVFVIFLCLFMELITGTSRKYHVIESFQYAIEHKNGGGAIGGSIAMFLCPAIGKAGTFVVDIVALIISIVLLTEHSFLSGVKKSSQKVYDTAREDALRRKNVKKTKKEKQIQRRIDRKVEGVALDTKIRPIPPEQSDNISELKLPKETEVFSKELEKKLFSEKEEKKIMKNAVGWEAQEDLEGVSVVDISKKREQIQQGKNRKPTIVEKVHKKPQQSNLTSSKTEEPTTKANLDIPDEIIPNIEASIQPEIVDESEIVNEPIVNHSKVADELDAENKWETAFTDKDISKLEENTYVFPPISLLTKGKNTQGDSKKHLQETALKLQQTLKNFGVNVTITDVSCGPSVTRYEMQPEMGVKVSKIVNLSDDIKLNLAAADIRIEAPIPGKAAVGIEVPNKENIMVRFRDMIESEEFQQHKSNICFAAGKGIGGQAVVADIAKMPHLLIAGATGSGKSVCINTIIMSILYKADPEDVKLILIDPKVVELSVYNGIPHLLIPVVTDPKKAAGALHWAVAEMMDRYQKFADCQVRDLKGYNQKITTIEKVADETKPVKLPQIVVVVDELADLMMVAPGDVEDAICRLAQLARAAGIHLIIATQRPSVDVITGLIKANMPSRIAFSVSSGVDSRTILDMNGAEKLLGNGDMLFYPQGYQKPLRVQGPFVSDQEVEAVVDFLKQQNTTVYNSEIEEKVSAVSFSSSSGSGGSGNERDAHFVEAGKFIIEKEKGSIGMLQRMFKIGFNRAARIMDQLEEAGVVGPEEGTKPRKVQMSLLEFEEYVKEHR